MSRIANKFAKLIKQNKPSESVGSSRLGRSVGDSARTMESRRITNFVTGTFVGLIVLGVGALIDADSVSAVASTLTVSVVSGADQSISIPSIAEGKFVSSDATKFSVSTNHASGYTITVSATALKDGGNSDDDSNTIPTLNSGTAINAATFADPANIQYNNFWGYLPSKYYDSANKRTVDNTTDETSFYLPAPISAAQTLDITNGATSGNIYDIAMGARVNSATVAGEYTSTLTVAVVGNATPYTVTYNKNTTDTVSNMPSNHVSTDAGASGEKVALASNTPTRTGYTFQGWCTAAVSDGASCTGTSYNRSGTYTLDQTSTSNSLTLYARWSRNSYNVTVNFAGAGVTSVQFAASGYTTRTVTSNGGIASLVYGVRYTVTMNFTDDGQFVSWAKRSGYGTLSSTATNPTYFTVGAGAASITATGKEVVKTYMQDFTNAMCSEQASSKDVVVYDKRDGNDYTVRYINENCWMTQNLRFTGSELNRTTSDVANSYTEANPLKITWYDSKADGVVSGGKCQYENAYDNACLHVPDSEDLAANGLTAEKVGVWYNFAGATAGTVTGYSSSSTVYYSICPSGWELPEYSKYRYGPEASGNSSKFSPIKGGHFSSGGKLVYTDYGHWWTATYKNSTARTVMQHYSSVFNNTWDNRYVSVYVRCMRSN